MRHVNRGLERRDDAQDDARGLMPELMALHLILSLSLLLALDNLPDAVRVLWPAKTAAWAMFAG